MTLYRSGSEEAESSWPPHQPLLHPKAKTNATMNTQSTTPKTLTSLLRQEKAPDAAPSPPFESEERGGEDLVRRWRRGHSSDPGRTPPGETASPLGPAHLHCPSDPRKRNAGLAEKNPKHRHRASRQNGSPARRRQRLKTSWHLMAPGLPAELHPPPHRAGRPSDSARSARKRKRAR